MCDSMRWPNLTRSKVAPLVEGIKPESKQGGDEKNNLNAPDWSPFRKHIAMIVRSRRFTNFILFVIVINTLLITFQMIESIRVVCDYWFEVVDKILMGIYLVEIAFKLYALRSMFFKSGWNLFDGFIVSLSLIEAISMFFLTGQASFSPQVFRLFRIFKAFRAFRAMRAISFLKNLQLIIDMFIRSIPALGSILFLISIIMYVFAIIGVNLFGNVLPHQYGTIGKAVFTLFQLITLDDWSRYKSMAYEKDPNTLITPYMIIFILLETFIGINLFIAVIVNNLEKAQIRQKQRIKHDAEQKAKLAMKEQLSAGAQATKQEIKKETYDESSDEEKGAEQEINRINVDEIINDETMTYWERQLQPKLLTLLASLDHKTYLYYHNQENLDHLVDASVKNEI